MFVNKNLDEANDRSNRSFSGLSLSFFEKKLTTSDWFLGGWFGRRSFGRFNVKERLWPPWLG